MKPIVSTLVSVALSVLGSAVTAQTIFTDAAKLLKDKTEAAKTSMADRPTEVNRLIAGNWRDKAQVTVSSLHPVKSEKDKYLYSWIGDVTVQISNSGKLSLLLANGCRYVGDYLTFASDTAWSVEGQFENCSIATLNRRIIGRIVNKNQKIFLTLTQTAVTIDPQVAISVRTTLLSRF